MSDARLDPFRAQMGVIPDGQIAQMARVSRSVVVNYRKHLGIPAYEGYQFGHEKRGGAKPAPAKPAPAKPAPAKPAPAKPASASAPVPTRRRASALDRFTDIIGVLPDAEVARRAKVTPENVRTWRVRHGVAAGWRQPAPVAPPAPAAPGSMPAIRSWAGVARAVGMSESALRNQRGRMGDDTSPDFRDADAARAWHRGLLARIDALPTDAVTAPAAAPVVAETAFLVVSDAGSHVVVAPDIHAAAVRAMRHAPGVIRSIQRVAEMLG